MQRGTDERDHPPADDDSHGAEHDLESVIRIAPQLAFPVVAVGAPADGLEALQALTRALSGRGLAVVVKQHATQGPAGGLAETLARGTTLRVKTVEDRAPLERGTIYVAPPGANVEVAGGALRLAKVDPDELDAHAIDALMRSLALSAGAMSIGVVLAGCGADGVLGLKAIRSEGGITLAQDPATVSQGDVPPGATDAGSADACLAPAEIGQELVRLAEHPYVSVANAAARERGPLDQEHLAKVFACLRAHSGVDFAQYKHSTIDRRIGRRMALYRLDRLEDYLKRLDEDPHEVRRLYGDLLVGVTSFFRDVEPFDALKDVVLPRLLENRAPDSRVRVWVAGCATGEEAYSTAIVLLEYLGERASQYQLQLFATDIDEDALVRARNGVYPQQIERDVTRERLDRFFVRTPSGGYQVARAVRELVVFARHDLGKDPPFSSLDLVACRNVLIYMQAPLQQRVLRTFQYALAPRGCLLLGASESVGEGLDLFRVLDRRLRVYMKQNVPSSAVFELGASAHLDGDSDPPPSHTDRRPISVTQIADRKVIEKYAPPGVIIDDKLEILQFRGKTGAFLDPSPGQATLSLLKLVRPELAMALRTTVHKALVENLPATSPPVHLTIDQTSRAVCLDVIALPDQGTRRCLLVLFREVLQASLLERAAIANEPESEGRIEIERELATTREYLQSTVEELEAANEELQSSNEELQASNEELQSTNEELETSREELQSTNEELATVNDELHSRVEELSVASDDLQNVLLLSSAAVLIVDPDLRIRRFSSAAEKLLNLIPGDVGRPIGYLRNVMNARDIEHIAAHAVESVTVREQRVRAIDGAWYLMKLAPYRTGDHAIRGLIVELSKTSPPAAVSEGPELSPLAERLLSSLPHALMVLDRRLTLGWANRAFFETFAVGPAALGRPLAEIWGSPSQPPELWGFLEDLVSGNPVRDVLVERPFGRGSDRPMRFAGRLVRAERGEPDSAAAALVYMQDL
jgi:two-component system CheB/CheR fusion protein